MKPRFNAIRVLMGHKLRRLLTQTENNLPPEMGPRAHVPLSFPFQKCCRDTSGVEDLSVSFSLSFSCVATFLSRIFSANFSTVSPCSQRFPRGDKPLSQSSFSSCVYYICRTSERIEVVNGYDRRFNMVQSRHSGLYLRG